MQTTYDKKLRLAERHLKSACPKLREWIAESGKCSLTPEWSREPVESLVRAVAHQQLHGKAAASILGRLVARYPMQTFPTPQQLSRMRTPTLRACGFSAAKTEAIRGIAKGQVAGCVPNRADANGMTDAQLIAKLTELRGIGTWTVEMLLIFTMGRLDIMPMDDFGVRAGLTHLYSLETVPKKADFALWTNQWAPYRSIGAWYLWRLADARK